MEEVILVDEKDQEIGTMEKLLAHEKGLLHRAFSVLIFNDSGELLIHKRSKDKYHCGGLWTNACCSHPRKGEAIMDAANRRLFEEMGFNTPLKHVDEFVYKAKFENGLTEYEYDHVLIGIYSENPNPNPDEVEDWKYMELQQVKKAMHENPNDYTAWFIDIITNRIDNILEKHYDKSL